MNIEISFIETGRNWTQAEKGGFHQCYWFPRYCLSSTESYVFTSQSGGLVLSDQIREERNR